MEKINEQRSTLPNPCLTEQGLRNKGLLLCRGALGLRLDLC